MKKILFKSCLLFIFILSATLFLSAQNVGDNVTIKMRSGSIFSGELTELNDSTAVLKTNDFGSISLSVEDIKDIKHVDLKEDGKYWYKNINVTQYLYGSNGYALRKGEAHFQNTWVLFNTINYGLSDNFSIGAGLGLLNLFFGEDGLPGFSLQSKYSFPIIEDKLNVSANAMYINWSIDQDNIGIFYGANTFGNRDKNGTIGLGFIISDGTVDSRPLLNLAGAIRVGPKFGLVTENWIMVPMYKYKLDSYNRESNFETVLSFGGRHIGRSIIIDFSFLIIQSEDVVIPWLSVTLPIGK